jgi:O-methyltransferase
MDNLYIDLLKTVLTRYACPDRYRPVYRSIVRKRSPLLAALYNPIYSGLDRFGLRLCLYRFNAEARTWGEDWPPDAETMVGLKRLENVQFCVEDVLARGVPGDFAETGVWRGGVCILIRAILKAHGVTNRVVWLADSFEGLPEPDARFPQDRGDKLSTFKDVLGVSLETVKANFERYGLLDDQVRFLKGWFKDTLPISPIERLAVLRLDGDMYASTMDALVNLYDKVSPGGYIIVDDYGQIKACKQAIDDFRDERGISSPICQIDRSGVYWKKEG